MSWTPHYHTRNLDNLNDLAPNTKAAALKWYQYCVDNKIDILIYETIRTVKQQEENVKKGASQTMKSYHLVGQALDFVPIVDGKAQWSKSAYANRPFLTAIEYAEKLGFESGYRWGWDAPHLQFNYKGYGTDKGTVAAAAPKNYLESGDSGDKVKELQTLLNKAGADPQITADGDFGAGTEVAVKQFQRRAGLTVDGIAGTETTNKLKAVTRETPVIQKEETKVAEEYKKDAAPSPRFADAQKWVIEKGISDGTYPQRPITREEAWSMLKRMSEAK